MPLSSAVSKVISSGNMNTAQTCIELIGSVSQMLKPVANFFVRQAMKNCSVATRNGSTKITRNASVRFSFSNSAWSARTSDILCSPPAGRLIGCECEEDVFERRLGQRDVKHLKTMIYQQSVHADRVVGRF